MMTMIVVVEFVYKFEKAIQVNIAIMRAFVLMRQYALNFQELALKIQELEKTYDKTFDDVFDVLNHLLKKDKQLEQQTKREKIGFKKIPSEDGFVMFELNPATLNKGNK